MTQAEFLEETLKHVGIPVKYYEYLGIEPIYLVYNEAAEKPTNYGDNQALARVIWWQVHLFSPKEHNFREIRARTEELLRDAGFTITEIRSLFERETKTIHTVIYCCKEESEE